MKRKAAQECQQSLIYTARGQARVQARVCSLGLEYCRNCFKETIEMVSEKGRIQGRSRLLLLSNFTR